MANITVRKGLIGATDVSWGTGTFTRQKSDGTYMNVNQIYAASIPIADGGGNYTSTNVEGALSESSTNIHNLSASVAALSASHTSANTSQASTISNLIKYWWKSPTGVIKNTSNTRVTFPAAYYPVGGKIYYSAATIGWSTTRGAKGSATWNRGMDWANATKNVQSKPVSDWVYFYAVPPRVSTTSTPAFVGSGTYPTRKYNTSSVGHGYGSTNTYVGCVRFSAASNVVGFTQSGNLNKYEGNLARSSGTYMARAMMSATGGGVILPQTITAPPISDLVLMNFKVKGSVDGTPCGASFYDK